MVSEKYDRDYFENGIATKKSNYKDYSWERLGSYFQATAKHIIKCFKPKSLLDVGCAKGFLVNALDELEVNARGVDVSEYAICNAKFRGLVTLGMAQNIDYPSNYFDVVTALDVLEHIPEEEIPQTCAELLRVAKKWVVVRVPTKLEADDLDAYHETIRPKEWWEQQFTEAGGSVLPCDSYVDKSVWWFNVPEYLIIVEKPEKQEEKPKAEAEASLKKNTEKKAAKKASK